MFINGYIALGVLALVFFLIIGRSRLNNIPIWTSMLIGAGLLVGLQVISIEQAFKAINLEVIIFLFGMFSIVSALDSTCIWSQYWKCHNSYWKSSKSADSNSKWYLSAILNIHEVVNYTKYTK